MGSNGRTASKLWSMAETSRSALLRELGAEVAEARRAAGLGVRELARLANISSHSRVSELENGKKLLAPDELGRIFEALHMPPDEQERLYGLVRSAKGPVSSTSACRVSTRPSRN